MPLPTDLLAALDALSGDWHAAGCLEKANLEALAKHAAARRVRRSVETGAGKSTLLLSHLSERHTVFAVNAGESLSRTRDNGLLRKDSVEFIEGPTQLTLMAHEFTEPLQLVFIDGPHHDGDAQRAADAVIDRKLDEQGYVVVRFGKDTRQWPDIFDKNADLFGAAKNKKP